MNISKAIAGAPPVPDNNRFTSFYLHMNINKGMAGVLLVLSKVRTSITRLITASHGASPIPVRCYVNDKVVSQYRKAKEEKM